MNEGDANSKPAWGNVRFGRRISAGYPDSEDRSSARFAIGLSVFIIVALVYPWYAYWVQSRLLAWEIQAALEQTANEADAASARMRAQATAASARQLDSQQRERLSRVSVRGFSEGGGATIVIVDLGAAGLLEAKPVICAQLQRLRGSGTFDDVRVQKFRGASPALTIGTIRCEP